jgi:hypothetical protein
LVDEAMETGTPAANTLTLFSLLSRKNREGATTRNSLADADARSETVCLAEKLKSTLKMSKL